MTWNEMQIEILIKERRNRNEEFWSTPGTDRVPFWESIASKINIRFQSTFTGKQCREKFQNLVRETTVRKKLQKLEILLRVDIYIFYN
jgi:hypothetical protein